MKQKQSAHWTIILIFTASLLAGCAGNRAEAAQDGSVKITLGAYTTPREAYQELIPMFQAAWEEETGQVIVFEESYLGSGAQSRAIVEGFEVDVAALSLEPDIQRLVQAGLITHDWKSGPSAGMVSRSVVAFAVRAGNPLGIHDWADLAKPGVEVLTPNPKTSGGAMWNVLALYGAAQRGYVEGVPAGDDEAAGEFLRQVLNNVTVMDKGARESITNFEKGVGDVAITYENEVLVGQRSGETYELVIPRSTLLIENPAAVVDIYAAQHGSQEAAQAFVEFLFSPEAQAVFMKYGLRPVTAEETAASQSFAQVEDLFTIEHFGGWDQALEKFFSESGIFTQALGK